MADKKEYPVLISFRTDEQVMDDLDLIAGMDGLTREQLLQKVVSQYIFRWKKYISDPEN